LERGRGATYSPETKRWQHTAGKRESGNTLHDIGMGNTQPGKMGRGKHTLWKQRNDKKPYENRKRDMQHTTWKLEKGQQTT
jgi:hypothetical protein